MKRPDKRGVRNLETNCAASLVAGDYEALTEILAHDWILVDAAGQVSTRDQIFKALADGDLKFNSYELPQLDIRIVGDTAVVVGHGHPRGQFHGQTFEENEVFTDTFVRTNGKWHCVLTHSTDVPQ